MRVLVCPTAFKGTLGAAEAADAMARGVRRVSPRADIRRLPLSDGGPGLVDTCRAVDARGTVEKVEVSGPLGEPTHARLLWSGEKRDVVVVESADACGLPTVPEGEEDALRAHTLGVGELLQVAASRGARRIVVGLGGTATTDGGTGMARAFGFRFLDGAGEELPMGGGGLSRLSRIIPGRTLSQPVLGLADVETPLNQGRVAARTFGASKGAKPGELEQLVEGLERLSKRLEADLGAHGVESVPGTGAAGGLGAGLVALHGAELVLGSDWVLDCTGFPLALDTADLVVTGEGAYDATSVEGKITGRVLERARAADVPLLLLCGRLLVDPPAHALALGGRGPTLSPDDLANLAARGTIELTARG